MHKLLLSIALILCGGDKCAFAEHSVTITALVHNADGHALSGLDESDFRVFDNDAPRRINGFRNLRPPRELIAARPPEGNIVSNRPLAAFPFPQPVTILLIDTRNTDPEFQPWMMSRAHRFLSLLRLGEEIAVYQLTSKGLRLLREFSQGNRQTTGDLESDTAVEFDRESDNPLLRQNRYRDTCAAVEDLARYLASFSGRKNLLWISGDFPPMGTSRKQPERITAPVEVVLRTLDQANVAVYPVEVQTEIAQEPFDRASAGSLSRIPLRRRRAMNSELWKDMEVLAGVTGGKPLRNRSQLGEAMFDAMEETRFAYDLTFTVPEADWDGRAHRLRIGVTAHDAAVLAKRTYVTQSEADIAKSLSAGIFDSPAIGLSVTRGGQEVGKPLALNVFIAARDLQWAKDSAGWIAKVEVSDGSTIRPETFALTAAEYERLATHTVSTQIAASLENPAQSLRISVRDVGSRRTGSVTVPAHFYSP